METWATFSIIDHRKPVYRQALALFDKIVVPIPPSPIGDQTAAELSQLRADVAYLVKKKAAVSYKWSSANFNEWHRPVLAEAIATNVSRDAYVDTRLMLAEKLKSDEVQAVPVYGGQEHYKESQWDLPQVEQALTLEIMQRLPVPGYDTPLENLVLLRNKPAFRTALEDLLDWKRQQVPAIVLAKDRKPAFSAALRDFDKLTKKYAEAMESAGYKTAGTVTSVFFALFTGEMLGAIKEGLVSLREVREPCWKKVAEMKCAPGGVVYHFKQEVK